MKPNLYSITVALMVAGCAATPHSGGAVAASDEAPAAAVASVSVTARAPQTPVSVEYVAASEGSVRAVGKVYAPRRESVSASTACDAGTPGLGTPAPGTDHCSIETEEAPVAASQPATDSEASVAEPDVVVETAETPTAVAATTKDPAFDQWLDPAIDYLLQVPAEEIDLSLDYVIDPDAVDPAEVAFATAGLQVGKPMPDMTLWSLSGEQVTLSDWQQKASVLLVLGSPSCPIFRGYARPRLAAAQEFADAITAVTGEKLVILMVLTQEAHPAIDPSPYVGQQWTGMFNVAASILLRQPTTFGARVLNGRAFAEGFNVDPTHVLVDGMDNAVWKMLGSLPNTAHLIDKNGVVVFKEAWAMHLDMSDPSPLKMPVIYPEISKLLGATP